MDGERVLPVPATPNNCSGTHPASWRNGSGKKGKHLYSLPYIAVTGATPQTEMLQSGTVPHAARRETTCHIYPLFFSHRRPDDGPKPNGLTPRPKNGNLAIRCRVGTSASKSVPMANGPGEMMGVRMVASGGTCCSTQCLLASARLVSWRQ